MGAKKSSTRSAEASVAFGDTVTAESIVARLVKEEGVGPETARRWFDEMLRFLDLTRDHTDDHLLVPSIRVDKAWHAFILYTRAYTAYCQERFGGYRHHDPTLEGDWDAQLETLWGYLRTRVAMAKRYGDLDEELWPLP